MLPQAEAEAETGGRCPVVCPGVVKLAIRTVPKHTSTLKPSLFGQCKLYACTQQGHDVKSDVKSLRWPLSRIILNNCRVFESCAQAKPLFMSQTVT